MDEWKSDGETVWWNSVVEQGTVMVEESGEKVWWKNVVEQCGETLEQCCGTVEQ